MIKRHFNAVCPSEPSGVNEGRAQVWQSNYSILPVFRRICAKWQAKRDLEDKEGKGTVHCFVGLHKKKRGGGGFKNRAIGLRRTAIKQKQKHDARCGSQKGELSAWVVYFVNVVRLTCWPLIAMLPIFRVTTLLPFSFDFQLEVWKRRWNSQDAFLFLSCTRSECCTADGRVIQKSVFSFLPTTLSGCRTN